MQRTRWEYKVEDLKAGYLISNLQDERRRNCLTAIARKAGR